MKLVKCSNGHFYDAEANDTCPYCDDMDSDNKTVQDDSSMIYGGSHPASPQQTSMPAMPHLGQDRPEPQPAGMNGMPNMPQVPGMNGMPDMPQVPGMNGMPNMPKPPVMNSMPPVPPQMPKPPVMNSVPPVPPNMPKPPVVNNVPPVSQFMNEMTQAAPVTNGIPNMQQAPMMNNAPNMPQAPMMNAAPNMPQAPMMNSAPNMPQAPMMNSAPNMPQAPMMNSAPNMPQTPMMNNAQQAQQPMQHMNHSLPVTGWLVCVSGEAKGRSYNIVEGPNYIGRRKDMDICIEDDISVSRYRHAVVVYNHENNEFLLKLGESKEKIYITRDHKKRILEGTVRLEAYDIITLGRTDLMFVPFCGESFRW